ncbi:protein nrt1/ ptr family 5.4, partial [Quercus suber]
MHDTIGWAAGIGMLAIALSVSLTMFLIGIKRYRKQGPLGSPLTTVAKVLVAAARKWRVAECGCYN